MMLSGADKELEFWSNFVKQDRFLSSWLAPKRTTELLPEVADFILSHPHRRVLDVGSGVVSILNGLIPSEHIITVDILGMEYYKIFNYAQHNIIPPLAIAGEHLFFRNDFDIVHMRNAIDHTQNPVLVYQNLMNAVKIAGYVIIQGFENEGMNSGYEGLHQWDFFIDGMDLCFKTNGSFQVMATANIISKRTITTLGRDWFIWVTQKQF